MKHSILFLTLLLALFYDTAFGQLPKPLQEYYDYVNNAELAITEGQYKKAMEDYTIAFSKKPFSFGTDLYNASICAALSKENKKCYSWLKIILQRGLNIKYLKDKTEFSNFFHSAEGIALEAECMKPGFKTYNVALRKTLDSLCDMDQLFRIKKGSYVLYGDTINKIDHSNVEKLNKIIAQYGFPDETLIGLTDSFNLHPQDLIIIHQQAGSRGRCYDYTDILKKAVEEGELNSKSDASLIDKSSGKELYGTLDIGIIKYVLDSIANSKSDYEPSQDASYSNDMWGYIQLSKKQMDVINKNRTLIGLDSVEEYRKKLTFNFKEKKHFIFSSISAYSIFVFSHKQEYEEALKQLIVIK